MPTTDTPGDADQLQLRELYTARYSVLVGQLYAVTGDIGEAQDAVQEAFTRALRHPARFGRLDNPEAWLRTVAVNVARRRWRRRRLAEKLLGRHVEPRVIEISTEHVALMAALRQLPYDQRAAIALHYLGDLSVEETAATLDIAPGTVKSRMARGRTRLAEMLGDEITHPSPARNRQGASRLVHGERHDGTVTAP